jgi:two-component system nitrogen regulation response regulator GlnG
MSVLLVIDDEASILHAFRKVFRNPGLTVLTAASGGEGLELAARMPPDVVILDLRLPDMSGLDVYRQLREGGVPAPVIFITGHGSSETAIDALNQGAYAYLPKPLELTQIREVVASALADAAPGKTEERGSKEGVPGSP